VGIRANHSSPQEQRFFHRSKVFERKGQNATKPNLRSPSLTAWGGRFFPVMTAACEAGDALGAPLLDQFGTRPAYHGVPESDLKTAWRDLESKVRRYLGFFLFL
jgi:hypothetical protein